MAVYSTTSNAQSITNWSELWNGVQQEEQVLDPDNNVNTHCDFQTGKYAEEMAKLSSFKNIEVKMNNKKKWIRNGLAILKSKGNHVHKSFFTLNDDKKFEIKSNFLSFSWEEDKFDNSLVWDSFTDYMTIEEKYKTKFKAKVIVNYDFGTCIYDARVRQTGDMMDHISYERNYLIQSLSIQLEQGSIANIVNFKLFRKEARNSISEILMTLLLKELDYIAPRTRLVSVNVNGNERDMLFQENPVKEMLEKNLRREGPLFEGDESVQWNSSSYTDNYEWKNQEFVFSLSNTRIENKNWAMQNNTALKIALKAQSKLQLVYMDWRSNPAETPSEMQRSIKIDPLTQGNAFAKNDLEAYNILMLLGLGDQHQFSSSNRKFFWNSLRNAFEPIYYDSMIPHNKIPDIKPFKFKNDQEYFYSKKFIKIVKNLNFKLNDINIEKLIDQAILLCRGRYCVKNNLQKFYNDIKDNLKEYQSILEHNKNNLSEINENLDKERVINDYKNRLFHFLPNSNVYFIDINSVNDKNIEQEYIKSIKCNAISCEEILVTKEFILDLLKAETYGRYEQHTFGGIYNSQKTISKTFIKELEIEITHSLESSVIYDDKSKTIKFYQKNHNDWFLLSNNNLSNLNFEMISSFEKNDKKLTNRFNEFGLTGCLNFFKVNFVNVNIKILGGGCEDSLNIIRSTGEINEIIVSNALSDAVDLDFSDLKVKFLDVSEAQNDCLDVSGGKYYLYSGLLSNCGDKGISVGESSNFKGKNIFIDNSDIGISSKDSSLANIEYFSGKDLSLCLEAYQKKQEFYGSKLFVDISNCLSISEQKENNFVKDKNSLISINGIQHNTNMYN